MLPVGEYGCGCALRCGDEITGRLTPIPGMDQRFRIGQSCGDTFDEEDDFDGYTLTVEVDSLDQGEAFLRALRKALEGDT